MDNLTVNILAYPVLPYTLLVAVVALYWLIAAFGIFEVDSLDVDIDADLDAAQGLTGLLMKLGLNGVPLTIVVTFISIYGWIVIAVPCQFAEFFMIGFVSKLLIGTPIFIAGTYVAVKLTVLSIKPLRKFFKRAEEYTEKKLVGQICVVRTTKVTESFGEASFDDGGAGLILRIRAPEEKGFKNGDKVVLFEHLEHEGVYRVVSEDEFKYGQ